MRILLLIVDVARDPTEKLTDYTKILADNWNMTQLILEDFADSLFSDPNYSSHLM